MKTKIDIDLTANQLAEMFIHWQSDEQAKFFNLIGKHFKKCDFDSEAQCCWLTNDIDKLGKDFIYTIANFLKAQKLNINSPHHNMLINHY